MAHTGCLELKVKLGWSKRWCNVTLPREGSGEPARFFRYKAPPPSDFVSCADLVGGVSVEQDAASRVLRICHRGASVISITTVRIVHGTAWP